MCKKKILVLGSTGLFGAFFKKNTSLSDNYNFFWHSSNDLSVNAPFNALSEESFLKNLDLIRPDIVINLIALTDVDLCQIDINQAFKVNVNVNIILNKWIEELHNECKIIYISTDHVYDGINYSDEEHTNFVNIYALTKFLAEKVFGLNVKKVILRTNFFGKTCSTKKISFTDWIYKAALEDQKIYLADDIIFNPVSMKTLMICIEKTIQDNLQGTYNIASQNSLSKYDFGIFFSQQLNLELNNIIKTTADKVGFLTKRPLNMSMCTKKILSKGYLMPKLEDEIKSVALEYGK
jgi:dTDP-4-dehydrorhamnose reductase